MPAMQTVQIINKSGKIVSTSKHLVNIFKDAKDAYQEKKAEMKAEYRQQAEEKHMRKIVSEGRLNRARVEQRLLDDPQERRHRRAESDIGESGRSEHRERRRRPPLTAENLSSFTESITGDSPTHRSRRGSRTGDGHRRHKASTHGSRPASRHETHSNDQRDNISPSTVRPSAPRRHTEMDDVPREPFRPSGSDIARSQSSPNMTDDIDVHLAYGDMPPAMDNEQALALQKELELQGLMSKLDALMLEAECVQHSAQTIMKGLESNPEAMAAVALTLAEISTLVAKMSPGILTALKASAPAVVALLASPQFLIAGGLAVGVTIVMFGGYKIIKRIQASAKDKENPIMEEAIPFEGELSSVETWRRGITQGVGEDAALQSIETSVEGEFITPAADRLRKDKIRARAREEGRSTRRPPGSVATTEDSLATESSTMTRKAKKERKDMEKLDKKDKKRRDQEDSKWTKENAIKKPNVLTVFLRRQVDDFKSDRGSKTSDRSSNKRDGRISQRATEMSAV